MEERHRRMAERQDPPRQRVEEGSRRNADHLVLDAHNGIVDKASAKKPETIIGLLRFEAGIIGGDAQGVR